MALNLRKEDANSMAYVCRLCSSILNEPVRLICGHRYCQSCVNNRHEMIIQCLSCQEKTWKNEVRIDQDFRNQMNKFHVTCRLCNWTGIWKNYQNHLNAAFSGDKKRPCVLVHMSRTMNTRLEQINEQVIEISRNYRIINNQIKLITDCMAMHISR